MTGIVAPPLPAHGARKDTDVDRRQLAIEAAELRILVRLMRRRVEEMTAAIRDAPQMGDDERGVLLDGLERVEVDAERLYIRLSHLT